MVRVLALLLVFAFNNVMSDGFVGSTYYYDDYRYEQGAEAYAKEANSLIDVDAFVSSYASVGDWVGYHLQQNPLTASPLWYWIVCILLYITKTKWTIRIFNIVAASFAVVYVNKLANKLYGEETANRATNLLTYLPYPVFFSCFSYKDTLIMWLTFYLLYNSVCYYKEERLSVKTILLMVVSFVILFFMRGGVTAILLLLCFYIMFCESLRKTITPGRLALLCFLLAIVVLIVYRSMGLIAYKLSYYINRHTETLGNTTISALMINSPRDFYKLPIAYLFSVVMPIGLGTFANSWYSVIANVNVVMTPIAIGATFYIFHKKQESNIYFALLIYYLIAISTSLNIFRHYYSLIPISIIGYSDFITISSEHEKVVSFVLGVLFAIALIAFYGFA